MPCNQNDTLINNAKKQLKEPSLYVLNASRVPPKTKKLIRQTPAEN